MKPTLALDPVAVSPFAGTAHTDSGRLSGLRQSALSQDDGASEWRRPFRLSAALACRCIRVLLGDESLGSSQPPRGPG